MAATQKSVEKWRDKKWFNVHAPKLLGESIIGEIPALDEKSVLGRMIKVSLSWITQNPAHSFMSVGLRVASVDGNAAHTELNYLEQTYSYMHSQIRRESSAIYTIDKLLDKDGKTVVLKFVTITRNKVTTPKKAAIRRVLLDFERKYVSAKSTEEIVKLMIEGKFQADAIGVMRKIAPIGKMELKKIELERPVQAVAASV